MLQPQIIAVGGALLVPQDGGLLESYIIAAAGKPTPRICFIGTATGDDPTVRLRFYQSYANLPCVTSDLSLFTRTPADLRAMLFDCDIIQVGGGNTRSMLAVWRHWGLDGILREAWERGIVLTGSSAGMICWFAQGVTDSVAGALTPMDGLGFLPGSACPHFNGEADRRPTYHTMVAEQRIGAGIAADDGTALHYIGTELAHVVASRRNAAAYRIERDGAVARETRVEARLL